MKRILNFLFLAFFLILCTSTYVFSEDNAIFGECSTLVEPNVLIIVDSSGSMRSWVAAASDTRINIARTAVKNIIDDYADNNRFGIMRFNNDQGGYLLADCSVKDTYILDGDGDLKTGQDLLDGIADYKTYLKGRVDIIPASGWTPLAETLFEAGRYFAGENTEFNASPNPYTSPQGPRCRKNYIILMTDGEPTQDGDNLTGESINGINIDDYETDVYGGVYDGNDPELNNVAELLFENDINDQIPATGVTTYISQNVMTYPIGFGDSLVANDLALLQRTANDGQGKTGVGTDIGLLGDATSAVALEGVFHTIMAEITEKKTTFAAPIVPIAASSNAYAGDFVYLSMFKPDADNTQWVGNLKKYMLNDHNEFVSCEAPYDTILDLNGTIKTDAISCWSSTADGPNVASGGAGEKILGNSSRNIIYNDSSGANGFKDFNSTNLADSDFSFVPGDIDLDDFIDNITMQDEGSTGWKLYDLNHSKPAIAKTSNGDYLFVGSNGGMLHMIDDITGEEEWAFIPSEQFNRLNKVYASDDHYHFMDGSPTVADIIDDNSDNDNIVIIGERRGGNNYYAIKFPTTALTPVFGYVYTPTNAGQSWKKPDFINYKSTAVSAPTKAFLLTGGYDERYDHSDTVVADVAALNADADPTNDTVVLGGDIFIINASSGGPAIKTFSSGMEASIVSAWGVDLVENTNDAISQISAADLEGHIFALRDDDLDGVWQENLLFEVIGALTGKKIFGETNFVQEYINYYDTGNSEWKEVVGEFTYFGTGDRADPLDNQGVDKTNYFYCVKNDWITQNITTETTIGSGTLAVDNYGAAGSLAVVDVTDYNVFQGQIPTNITHILSKSNRGWYIELEGDGEKCMSTPLVYAGVVYFTTYTPPSDAEDGDPCGTSLIGGIAQLYALDYKTGGAVYNFDGSTSDDLTKTDRSTTINARNVTIPPDPVIIITEDGAKVFVGPQALDAKEPNLGINSFYWKPLL